MNNELINVVFLTVDIKAESKVNYVRLYYLVFFYHP